jgi:hypothetical protein
MSCVHACISMLCASTLAVPVTMLSRSNLKREKVSFIVRKRRGHLLEMSLASRVREIMELSGTACDDLRSSVVCVCVAVGRGMCLRWARRCSTSAGSRKKRRVVYKERGLQRDSSSFKITETSWLLY